MTAPTRLRAQSGYAFLETHNGSLWGESGVNRELFGIQSFRRVVITRGISALANWAVILASSYLVLQITDDPLAVGLLALAKGLPSLLLTSYGGSLADRYETTRAIAASYVFRALAIGGLAVGFWLEQAGLAAIYLASALAGCGAALAKASVAALVVQPVPNHLRQRAIVITSLTYSLGAIIGPVIAGTLLSIGGIGTTFMVAALALLAVAGLAYFGIKLNDSVESESESLGDTDEFAHPANPISERKSRTNWWQNLRKALANPQLRPAFLGIAMLSFTALPVLSLAAVIAKQYGKSPILLEVILAAAGIGSLLCNLVLMRVEISRAHRGPVAASSFFATAISIALAATAPTIAIEAIAFALLAASANVLWVVTSAAIQTDSPSATRGRMNGIFFTIASAGTSIGALIMSEFMSLLGVPSTLLGYAAILLVIGLLVTRSRHQIAKTQ